MSELFDDGEGSPRDQAGRRVDLKDLDKSTLDNIVDRGGHWFI